ncbi:hypothetical protein [Streptosporangium lutulentum]|uniref:Uncharacterized protein n=1 Tax=Streptosporangium lutulentum TaxID=1461250 RepID=A0ABT9QLJ7_9ACTN|nr:hypothetical protein [Streptosporangium lutulentum]MDP9847604.1 hypothetical protein [Streptosporangium lutulentum]
MSDVRNERPTKKLTGRRFSPERPHSKGSPLMRKLRSVLVGTALAGALAAGIAAAPA